MSKRAEQAALETYPPTHSEGKRHAKRVQSESVDTHQSVRTIFQKAYEQAEKDLALTWEDIEKITDIHRDVLYNNPKRIMGAKENYEDTLKEFNEWREKNRATKNN